MADKISVVMIGSVSEDKKAIMEKIVAELMEQPEVKLLYLLLNFSDGGHDCSNCEYYQHCDQPLKK